MAQVSPERLAREIRRRTPFPDEASNTMHAALEDAFPDGADAQCAACLDERDGLLVLVGESLHFARYEDGSLAIAAIGPLRGGILTKRYYPRKSGDGFRLAYRYAHERGTLTVEETATRESAQIFKLIERWAGIG